MSHDRSRLSLSTLVWCLALGWAFTACGGAADSLELASRSGEESRDADAIPSATERPDTSTGADDASGDEGGGRADSIGSARPSRGSTYATGATLGRSTSAHFEVRLHAGTSPVTTARSARYRVVLSPAGR